MSDLPAGRRPVGGKWVCEVKHNADGSVKQYTAGIVANRHSQIESLNDDATFAPVTLCEYLCLIIALATYLGLDNVQLDIKSAFLNRDLVEGF